MCIITVYPFWYTIIASLMKEQEFYTTSFILFVKEPTLAAYKAVFEDGRIFGPLQVTLFVTVVGTIASLAFTSYSAYGLSKPVPGAKLVMYLIVLTMFLNPGLIPHYLTYKTLGMINRLSVYIWPTLLHTFYLVVLRNNFREFPKELEESARIDGASDFRTFFQIVLPLSKAVLAAVGLFFAVSYWNTYMPSVFYITDLDKKTVQEYLRKLIMESSDISSIMRAQGIDVEFSQQSLKLANVVLIVTPIICLYPFLQKYFVKGMMIGAIKG